MPRSQLMQPCIRCPRRHDRERRRRTDGRVTVPVIRGEAFLVYERLAMSVGMMRSAQHGVDAVLLDALRRRQIAAPVLTPSAFSFSESVGMLLVNYALNHTLQVPHTSPVSSVAAHRHLDDRGIHALSRLG